MSDQTPATVWLDINEAAALAGKSVSTIRRALPDIEMSEPSAIRREPIEGKGGEKIYLSRSHLVKRFRIIDAAQDSAQGEDAQVLGAAAIVEMLERQLSAKDKQIEALQREGESKGRALEDALQNAAGLTESLKQFAAINTMLNNKIAALAERAGDTARPDERSPDRAGSQGPGLWYSVAISVLITLIAGLIIWLLLGWVGN